MLLGGGALGKLVARVVLHLVGVKGLDALALAKGDAEHLLGNVELLVDERGLLLGGIHRVDEGDGHLLHGHDAVVGVVEPGEHNSLHEGLRQRRAVSHVDGRGYDKAVGLGSLLQYGQQRVAELADARQASLHLAGHARHASTVRVKPIEAYALHLDFLTYELYTLDKCVRHLGGIHRLARAAVNHHNLLHLCICFSFTFCYFHEWRGYERTHGGDDGCRQ